MTTIYDFFFLSILFLTHVQVYKYSFHILLTLKSSYNSSVTTFYLLCDPLTIFEFDNIVPNAFFIHMIVHETYNKQKELLGKKTGCLSSLYLEVK